MNAVEELKSLLRFPTYYKNHILLVSGQIKYRNIIFPCNIVIPAQEKLGKLLVYFDRLPYGLIQIDDEYLDDKFTRHIDSLLNEKLNWYFKTKLKFFSIKRDDNLSFCEFKLTKEQIRSLYPIATKKGFRA